jgi:hypothetical protein
MNSGTAAVGICRNGENSFRLSVHEVMIDHATWYIIDSGNVGFDWNKTNERAVESTAALAME